MQDKRGKGICRKVSGKAKLPGQWMDFLRNPLNKTELFTFLSRKVERFNFTPGKVVFVTSGQSVLSVGVNNSMDVCNHEKADTRIVVHLVHALESGANSAQIRTVDTDVIVILIGVLFDIIENHSLADI